MNTVVRFTLGFVAALAALCASVLAVSPQNVDHTDVVQSYLSSGADATLVSSTTTQQVVHLTGHDRYVNQDCLGAVKMITVRLRVPAGNSIDTYGPWALDIRGRTSPLVSDGSPVNKRLVEYYFFPRRTDARVNLADLSASYAFAELSGTRYTAVVSSVCQVGATRQVI